MATTSSPLLRAFSLPRAHTAHRVSCSAHVPKRVPQSPAPVLPGRRQYLFVLTATAAALAARDLPAMAEDIPLFGLRKKLKKVEEEAEEILKEGIVTAEKGIETAERGIETAEREIVAAEGEIETAVAFGELAQAGLVAGAEFVGVLVAASVVNGILGPEGQKS